MEESWDFICLVRLQIKYMYADKDFNDDYGNPAHICGCGKQLTHRGFCSIECHNKYYDEVQNE